MNRIGFNSETENKVHTDQEKPTAAESKEQEFAPVKSLVQVEFDGSRRQLTYYNDRFDLKPGDIVYVDGKMEGRRGRVISLSKTFKIKLSDYKRVISVAQRRVKGRLYFAGSHLVSFDRNVLPYKKVVTWLKAPISEGEEYASSSGGETFPLDDLEQMKVSPQVAERGFHYYSGNRVCFLELDGRKGRAIVEGTKPYELEFTYEDGQIGDLTCECFCTYICKHELAAMLQLQETLKLIEEQYEDSFKENGYFSAVSRNLFFTVAANGQEKGSMEVDI